MGTEQVEIFTGDADRQYQQLGRIQAKVGAGTLFSKAPTVEDANSKLREEAMKIGANGVIYVEYKRGITATSYKGLTVTGHAVKLLDDSKVCPYCAETVKVQAVRCKHCGAELVA
jgi:hypothetical protein